MSVDVDITKQEEVNTVILHKLFKFGEIEHLDSLRKKGELYVNLLSHFQDLKDDPRQDSNESISKVLESVTIQIIPDVIPDGIDVPTEPLLVDRMTVHQYTHVFCCTGFYHPMKYFDDLNVYNPSLFSKFGNHFLIITNPTEFLKRLEQAIKKFNDENRDNIVIEHCSHKKVEYSDLTTDYHEINNFRKDLKYQEEEEFRIVFIIRQINPKPEQPYNKPIKLDLGALEDITEEIKSTQNLKILRQKTPNGFTVELSTD